MQPSIMCVSPLKKTNKQIIHYLYIYMIQLFMVMCQQLKPGFA